MAQRPRPKKKTPAKRPAPAARPKTAETADRNQGSGAYKEELKAPFIVEYRARHTIGAACAAVGVSRRTIQDWKRNDPEFRMAFTDAQLDRKDLIDRTVVQSALEGVIEYAHNPISGQLILDKDGKPIPIRWRKSDELLKFAAKAELPEKYGDKTKLQVDYRVVHMLSSEFLTMIRRHVPQNCFHCHKPLQITEKMAKDLTAISQRMGGVPQ